MAVAVETEAPPVKPAKAKEEPKPRFRLDLKAKLQAGRLSPAGSRRNPWFVELPAGTTPEQIMVPGYWAHYVHKLAPLDLIEVFCEDGSWEWLYRVMFVGGGEVRLSPVGAITRHDRADEEPDSDLYDVKWISPVNKYGVVNKATGAVIKDRLYPKAQAIGYLREHLGRVS